MSPHAANSLVHDLVQMAQAMEALPKVQCELDDMRAMFNAAQDTIQRLELKLIDRNTTIDELNAKVRAAEVARDDAELRFLEADDSVAKVRSLVSQLSGLVSPPKNEPIVESSPVVSVQADPTTVSSVEPSPVIDGGAQTIPTGSTNPAPEVVPAAHPTATSEEPSPPAPSADTTASPTADATPTTTTEDTASRVPGQSADPLPTSGADTIASGFENDAQSSVTTSAPATPTDEPKPAEPFGGWYGSAAPAVT